LSVVRALETAGIPFTGSDSRFYEISTSKVLMKSIFRDQGIETAPWEVLPASGPVQGVCERVGVPLIVKPDVSFASFGISLKSKVDSDAAIAARRDEIRQNEMGDYLPEGPIFAERYLGGDEYTVFVGGYRDRPDTIWNLPPARRCFAGSIPVEERFLTYDRYWGYYQEEGAPADDEPFYHYELVEGDLEEELAALARCAYRAVEGYGYARVDIRRDTVNGKLSLLEVNANCGLSGDDQTSTGSILRLMGWDFPGLLLRLVTQTLDHSESPGA
jgi:D-alanine-D-alanine ligase